MGQRDYLDVLRNNRDIHSSLHDSECDRQDQLEKGDANSVSGVLCRCCYRVAGDDAGLQHRLRDQPCT